MQRNRMSVTNSKLGGNTLIYSQSPGPIAKGGTCLNCASCSGHGCYAEKMQAFRPSVKLGWSINTDLMTNDLPRLESLLFDQLRRRAAWSIKRNLGEVVVRVNGAGDFHTQSMVDLWARLAKAYPSVRFYAYTKVYGLLDFSELESLPNFNLINSLPGGLRNYGSAEYLDRLRARFPEAVTCPYGQKDAPRCMDGCKVCLSAKVVLFHEH